MRESEPNQVQGIMQVPASAQHIGYHAVGSGASGQCEVFQPRKKGRHAGPLARKHEVEEQVTSDCCSRGEMEASQSRHLRKGKKMDKSEFVEVAGVD